MPGPEGIAGLDAAPADPAGAGAGPDAAPPPGPQRRLRRRWRLLRGLAWMVAGLCVLGAGAVYFGLGTRLDAPQWVRARVEQRIERHLNGLDIEFGEIHLVVNQGFRPRIGLRDVVLRHPDGTAFAQLADARASLALRPLLRGRLQPKQIALSGLFATLNRGPDGAFSLSFSGGTGAFSQAETLADLIEQWDSQLEKPVMAALTSVETSGLSLRYRDERLGREWTLDGGRILLQRARQDVSLSASFSVLSGREDVGRVEASYTSAIGSKAADFGVVVSQIASEDIALQTPALGWLGVLRAPISGSMRGGIAADGAFDPLSASLQIGEGVIQPEAQTKPVPITGARSYFTYDPAMQSLDFTELRLDSGWGSGVMQGQARLSGIRDGRLEGLAGQLEFTDLTLDPARLFDEPVRLSGIAADFELSLAPFRFRLGEMLVRDGASRLLLDGSISAGPAGWDYDLNGRADQVSVARVKELWPAALGPKPREWVMKNLFAGQVSDAGLHLRGRGSGKPFVSLNLAFSDTSLRFQKHMPPLQDAAGQLSLYGHRFVVTAEQGTVTADQGGAVDVTGTSFIIPDTTVRDGTPGIVRIMAEAPVTAALSLLNRPPLKVMDKANLPVNLAEGRVEASGTLALPLKKGVQPEEIQYHYSGTVTDVASSKLVPGRNVAARALQLKGDQGRVSLSGDGSLSGIPLTAAWSQQIGKDADKASQVSGTVELSAAAIEAFDIGLPKGSVSGRGQGRYVVDLQPGEPPRLELSSDLAGVGLRIPQLGWRKRAGTTGRLALTAVLGKAASVPRLELEAPGLSASGRVTTRAGGGLERAVFDRARVGNWFSGSMELRGRGAAPPAIAVTSGSLALNRSPFGAAGASSGTGGGGAVPITLRLQELQVTDGITLTGFQGRFSTQGGMNGEFTGRLNGQTPISGTVVPQGGGTAARIRANDAGSLFRAAGVFRHGQGGSFDMTLVPAGTPGEYEGRIKVRDTRVKNAPSMAALLNAISLVGLIDEMTGQGILFTSMEARFRLAPSYLAIYDSNAVGPSMGLTLDGNYDLASGRLNMRGVISPIYLLNAIGSVLTRKGEGLIGIAFKLRGSADDPQVSVNPLSALAPGMFRELFRGPAPALPGGQGAAPTPPDEAEAAKRRKQRLRGKDR